MILTLTLNTAIDHILHIPAFELGETIRSSRSYLAMGGKGTDASYILGTLGIPNIAMGFKAGISFPILLRWMAKPVSVR